MQQQLARANGSLHVTDLAQRAGVTPATIRYYARIGLLNPGREPDNGYRCFTSDDLHRVSFIRQAQAVGLTIADIKTVLDTVGRGEIPCPQVRSMVIQRLAAVREQITQLEATESRIEEALATWKRTGDQAPGPGEVCPLIERLEAEDRAENGGRPNGRVGG